MISFLEKMIHREKFPTKLFVIASIAGLFLFGFLLLFLKNNYFAQKEIAPVDGGNNLIIETDQIDPFITKAPTLKDIIKKPIINSNDPSFGPNDAKINIVMFSDYECSYCQKVENILNSVIADYQDKARIIWKDYPDNNTASLSWQASVAARCAWEQGKFWEYHDLLFSNSNSLNPNLFLSLASELNLDKSAFGICLENKNISQLIYNNVMEAQALDIIGVPFIFVNDKEIMGDVSIEDLKKIVEEELAK